MASYLHSKRRPSEQAQRTVVRGRLVFTKIYKSSPTLYVRPRPCQASYVAKTMVIGKSTRATGGWLLLSCCVLLILMLLALLMFGENEIVRPRLGSALRLANPGWQIVECHHPMVSPWF